MHSCMENWRVSGAHKLNQHRSVAHRGLVLAIKQSSLFENGSDGGQSAHCQWYTQLICINEGPRVISDRQVWVGVVVKGCDA